MTHTIALLFTEVFTVYSLVISGSIGLVAGFVTRLAVNAKQRGNIRKLENEMLNNH